MVPFSRSKRKTTAEESRTRGSDSGADGPDTAKHAYKLIRHLHHEFISGTLGMEMAKTYEAPSTNFPRYDDGGSPWSLP